MTNQTEPQPTEYNKPMKDRSLVYRLEVVDAETNETLARANCFSVESIIEELGKIERHMNYEELKELLATCVCRKCGDQLQCLHGKDESHVVSLCGNCAQ